MAPGRTKHAKSLMTVNDILKQLTTRYETCNAYRDNGHLYSWIESHTKTKRPQIVFKTYFEHPTKIRIEWLNAFSSHSLWCDGAQSYTCSESYNSGPSKEREESPGMAIAGHNGSGTA